ncbi:ImmA/IrrE family metallo-endopeptidase [Achromobacter ruhlandii]|jgi:Zn-dependent peptidase ImmA (M78 family)|nr:ImmA/IrrE family metallo-endopeptidase [Achromobacter ruhlandii]
MSVFTPSRVRLAGKLSAAEVLDLHWDGDLPVDPESIAKAMGIRIEPEFGLDGGASGMIELQRDGSAVIYYDMTEVPVRQRFTIAHEIGHYARGHLDGGQTRFRDTTANFRTFQADPAETEANQFAADLLMPARIVRYAVLNKGVRDVSRLANLFFVSQAAMGFRLKNLGLA